MRASRDFRRSRCGAASKIAPNHGDAGLEEFVAVLEIFENHWICWGALEAGTFLQGLKAHSLPDVMSDLKVRPPKPGQVPENNRRGWRRWDALKRAPLTARCG